MNKEIDEKVKEVFEAKVKNILENMDSMIRIQGRDGNWNSDPYMHGMINGMYFMRSLVDNESPGYKEAPEQWLCKEERILNKFRPIVKFITKVTTRKHKPIAEETRGGK